MAGHKFVQSAQQQGIPFALVAGGRPDLTPDRLLRFFQEGLMMLKRILSFSLLWGPLVFLFGCTTGAEAQPQPADFSLDYHWSESALPPPYHYEYTIHLGPGSQGLIEFWPDYPNPGTPVWTETFELKDEDLEKLYAFLQAKGLLEEQAGHSEGVPPGAPSDGLRVMVEGRQFSLPGSNETEGLAEVVEAVKTQVPAPLWTKLMAQYEQYQQEFLAGEANSAAAIIPTLTSLPTAISEGGNEMVKTDDFEGVIFSAENAATTRVANQGESYWTPSQMEVLPLENRLGLYLQQTAPRTYPGPLRDLSEYKRQYLGVLANGQRVIHVNFFCNAHGLDWSQEFVFVTDGGSCYFEVKYNVETGEFSDLSIHGEA